MKLEEFPQVQALSTKEKLQLVDEIWFSVARDLQDAEVTDDEKRILDDRWAKYERDPSAAFTLAELKAKLDGLRR